MTMPELVIVGDEAWLPEEWETEQRRRREKNERRRGYWRRYRAANRDRLNAYNREWMRRHRSPARVARVAPPRLVGTLHTLTCTGPTIKEGCVCGKQGTRKIRMYDKPVQR